MIMEVWYQWFLNIHLFYSYGLVLWFDSWWLRKTSASTVSGLLVITFLSELFLPLHIVSESMELDAWLFLASDSFHLTVVDIAWAGSQEQGTLMTNLQLLSWIVLWWYDLSLSYLLCFFIDVWISLMSCLMTYMEVGKSLQDTIVLCSPFLKTPNLR